FLQELLAVGTVDVDADDAADGAKDDADVGSWDNSRQGQDNLPGRMAGCDANPIIHGRPKKKTPFSLAQLGPTFLTVHAAMDRPDGPASGKSNHSACNINTAPPESHDRYQRSDEVGRRQS